MRRIAKLSLPLYREAPGSEPALFYYDIIFTLTASAILDAEQAKQKAAKEGMVRAAEKRDEIAKLKAKALLIEEQLQFSGNKLSAKERRASFGSQHQLLKLLEESLEAEKGATAARIAYENLRRSQRVSFESSRHLRPSFGASSSSFDSMADDAEVSLRPPFESPEGSKKSGTIVSPDQKWEDPNNDQGDVISHIVDGRVRVKWSKRYREPRNRLTNVPN